MLGDVSLLTVDEVKEFIEKTTGEKMTEVEVKELKEMLAKS